MLASQTWVGYLHLGGQATDWENGQGKCAVLLPARRRHISKLAASLRQILLADGLGVLGQPPGHLGRVSPHGTAPDARAGSGGGDQAAQGSRSSESDAGAGG